MMAATPAGTQIQAAGEAYYLSGDGTPMPTASSNAVTSTVAQVASVSVSPASDAKQADPGSTVDFAVSVTNTGNGSDTFDLSTALQNGSTVTIYRDDNGDGERQSTETTVVTATSALQAGETFKCIVSAQLPSDSTASSESIVFTAESRYDTTTTAHSALSVQINGSYASAYVLTWLLNGYYPHSDESTRLTTDYLGGESLVVPLEGSVSGGKTWFRVDSSSEYLDIAQAFGYPSYCAGYAHVYVYSPETQTVNMWIGSNDGAKIWLNGEVVLFNDVYRSFEIDKYRTTATLSAGWNRLLVKVSQGRGSWGVSVKFCDSSGNQIPGISYSAVP